MRAKLLDLIKRHPYRTATILAVILTLITFLATERYYLNQAYLMMHRHFVTFTIWGIFLLGWTVIPYLRYRRKLADPERTRYTYTRWYPTTPRGWFGVVPLSIATFAVALIGVAGNGYLTDRAYSGDVTETDTAAPAYAYRIPFEIAVASAPNGIRSVGDTDTRTTTYMPSVESYGTLVRARTFLGGYTEVAYQQFRPTGDRIIGNCLFSREGREKSLNGVLHHNLRRTIVRDNFGVHIDNDDAYGYCDGEKPIVVVPLTKYEGILPVTQVPAGIAVYDGHTGNLTYHENVTPDDGIAGPVYPISLTERQRNATVGMGSFPDWVFNRVGYVATGNSEADPNHANNGEFILGSVDDPTQADFVTPLAIKGRATSIFAVSTTSASTVTAGERNPFTVHRMDPARDSNAKVAQDMKTTFPELQWAVDRFGVFEIAPNSPGKWVVTLGMDQAITNRVEVEPDGSACLFTPGGTLLRCASDDAPPAAPGGFDVAGLSDADLARLGQAVADEMVRRNP